MPQADDDVHVLETESLIARSETQVTTDKGGAGRALGLVGVVFAIVLAWSMISSSTSTEGIDDASGDAAEDNGDVASPVEASPVEDNPGEANPESSADGNTGVGAGLIEEALPEGRIDPAVPGVEDAAGVPVLSSSGDLVGSDLVSPAFGPIAPDSDLSIIVNNFSGEVEVIKLATGEVREHRLLVGQLIVQVGDHLVFQDQVSNFVMIVKASDLDGEVLRVAAPSNFAVALAAWPDGEGLITVLSANFSENIPILSETTVELDTGMIIATGPIDPNRGPANFFSAYAANRDVFTPPTGGVYVSEQGGGEEFVYRKVLDGRLLLADDRFALVQNCDGSMQCVRQWHEIETWEAVVRPIPEIAFELGLLMGASRVIVHVVPGDNSLAVFDVELDRDVPIEQSTEGLGQAVSPQGDFVSFFAAESGDLVLVDLDTLVETRLQLESNRGHVAFITGTDG